MHDQNQIELLRNLTPPEYPGFDTSSSPGSRSPEAAAPEPPAQIPAVAPGADSGKRPPPSLVPLPSPPRGPYRLPWTTCLRRVFAIDVLTCDRCGGTRRLVALGDK